MREDSGADAAETRLNRLLNLILETAVDVLGFDAATVTARHSDRSLSTVAATDQRLLDLDNAQYWYRRAQRDFPGTGAVKQEIAAARQRLGAAS